MNKIFFNFFVMMAFTTFSLAPLLAADEIKDHEVQVPSEKQDTSVAKKENEVQLPTEKKDVVVTGKENEEAKDKVFQPESKSSSWRFGLGLSYGLGAKMKFNDVTVSNSTSTLNADLDYDNTLSLELDLRKMSPHSWGFIAGLTYDAERDFSGGSISGGGYTIPVSSNNPSKIQTTVVSASAVYQWENIYLPFGLNYSFLTYTPSQGFTGTHEENGSLGGQVGVGFYTAPHFALEIFTRVLTGHLETVSSSGVKADYGIGYLVTTQLTAKVFF